MRNDVLYIVIIAILSLLYFSEQKKRKEMNESLNQSQKLLEATKKANLIKIDSLNQKILNLNVDLEKLRDSIPLIENQIKKIKDDYDKKKDDISNNYNSDSLQLFFARRYSSEI